MLPIVFCEQHLEEEKRVGHEINPASPETNGEDQSTCRASAICNQLGNEHGQLAW